MTDLVLVFRALGNPVRLAIVKELASREGEVAGCDILKGCSKASKLAQPTISQHFAKLVAAGVLIEQKQGNEKSYELNSKLFERIGVDPSKLV